MKIKEIIEKNEVDEVMITSRYCDGEKQTIIFPITSKKILRNYQNVEADIYYISLDQTLYITLNLKYPYPSFPNLINSGSHRGSGV